MIYGVPIAQRGAQGEDGRHRVRKKWRFDPQHEELSGYQNSDS